MWTILFFLRTALAYLALAVVLAAGARRTIAIPGYPETYTATYDDAKSRESQMKEWLLLSPYVVTEDSRNNFEMAGSRERTADNQELVDKGFFAVPIERCHFDGCGDHPRIDQAWVANALENLKVTQLQIERLGNMKLPSALEPVRAYLLSGLRFTFDLQRGRLDYVRTGKIQPLQERLAATCTTSLPADQKLFDDLAGAPLSQRLEVSNHWFNRLLLCQKTKGGYPMTVWKAFLTKYGVSEKLVFLDPDAN
jgi:hypothetical protein